MMSHTPTDILVDAKKGAYVKRPDTTPEEEAEAWREVARVLLQRKRRRERVKQPLGRG